MCSNPKKSFLSLVHYKVIYLFLILFIDILVFILETKKKKKMRITLVYECIAITPVITSSKYNITYCPSKYNMKAFDLRTANHLHPIVYQTLVNTQHSHSVLI